jgi:uncharacterized protein (TIGR02147 family)
LWASLVDGQIPGCNTPIELGGQSVTEIFIKTQPFRLYLQDELLRRVGNNPNYSLRAFAKSLDTDFSTLAKILKGSRPLGLRAIEKIGLRLGLGPSEIAVFQNMAKVKLGQNKDSKKTASDYVQVSEDEFHLISDWYCDAILELLRIDGFNPSPRAVAKALGISVNEVNAAVERLQRTGLIEVIRVEGKDIWANKSGEKTSSLTPGRTSSAQRLRQKQLLEKSIDALESVPVSRRNHTSMTMAIDVGRLPGAIDMITKFRRELAAFLSRGDKHQQVYNLSISLYPISAIQQGDQCE